MIAGWGVIRALGVSGIGETDEADELMGGVPAPGGGVCVRASSESDVPATCPRARGGTSGTCGAGSQRVLSAQTRTTASRGGSGAT